jgi:dihydroorotase
MELSLFCNSKDYSNKKITSEVCVHHLWFNKEDYKKKGTLIKWNPAVKSESDRKALINAINNDTLDVIATDHAPHLLEEKQNSYFKAPSGGPLVQHSLVIMLELVKQKQIKLGKLVEKMCHTPAKIYQIDKRGYIREGYWADLVLVDLNNPWEVKKENVLYKCKWSPFEEQIFNSKISHTFVNGILVFENGKLFEKKMGKRLIFNR